MAIIKRRAFFWIITAWAVLFFSSCAGSIAPKRIYIEEEFSCEVRWTVDGSEFCALIETGGKSAEGREIKMKFLSPPSLEGVSVSRIGGKTQIEYGEVRAELHNDTIMRVAILLCDEGSMSYKGKALEGGREIVYAERRVGDREDRLYVDIETGAPLRIESGDISLVVVWFEYKP